MSRRILLALSAFVILVKTAAGFTDRRRPDADRFGDVGGIEFARSEGAL